MTPEGEIKAVLPPSPGNVLSYFQFILMRPDVAKNPKVVDICIRLFEPGVKSLGSRGWAEGMRGKAELTTMPGRLIWSRATVPRRSRR